jgi:pimeloyl-ACP methyl ester carboxylesterase
VAATYVEVGNQVLSASNGVDYAYRTTGEGDAPPLVTLQHFRGNLDNWDPALIDALARGRRVVSFDNQGVAASSGTTPNTIAQMALDAIDFIDALEPGEVDLLGFSIFFTGSDASRAAGQAVLGRIYGARTTDRDEATDWQARLAQYDAVCAWGQPNHALLERVSAIDKPVFVANGDSDPMILPRYSYLLAGLIPGARLKIYPDSAHGFLFQHHSEFAADVDVFLTGA